MTEFRFRYFEGYGLVVAVVDDGPARFIYLTGKPPQSVRETCEGAKEQLEASVGVQRFPPFGVARCVPKRAHALRRALKQLDDFLLKRPRLLHLEGEPIRSANERQGADAAAGERGGELGEDGQVGMHPDAP